VDLHLLIEARKKSTRSRENQRARQQYLGREATSVGTIGWRRRIVYIMRDLGMPTSQQRLAMSVLAKVEEKRGVEYLNGQTTDTLRATLKAFQKDFKRQERITHPSHLRPGVSGVYRQGGSLSTRSGLERAWIDRQKEREALARADAEARGVAYNPGKVDLEPNQTYGKPPSSKQLRMNIAHVRTQDMTRADLEKHPHPDVRKLYTAINPGTGKLRRDGAVVWSADEKPFYILGQLSKPVHRMYMGKDFNLMFPRGYDYRGNARAIPLNRLDDYGRWTKWYTVMATKEMFKLAAPGQRKPLVYKGAIDTVIKKAQEYAWGQAKNFYYAYMSYSKGKKAVKAIRAKYRAKSGVMDKMPAPHKAAHDQFYGLWKSGEDQLQGRMPEAEFESDQARENWKKKLDHMGDSYTWYLWLLASEHQHGVRLPERQKLPENARFPTTKNPVQSKPEHWVIQPTGREEVPRWDTKVLKGIGFSRGDFHNFELALKNSNYKLGYQGNKAVTQLWIPLVGDLHSLYGLDSSKADISDYINDSKKQTYTDYIVGREGGGISVRTKVPLPQYKFQAGNPRKTYSLVPAVGYLQYFDSPSHGGARLVHGQKYLQEPPKKSKTKLDDASKYSSMSPRMRARSRSYQMRKYARTGTSPRFAYDMEKVQQDREKIATEIADRMLKQPVQAARAALRIRSKILQRQNLVAQIPGKKKITRVWSAPPRARGFIHSKKGLWELPTVGRVVRTKRHPVTGGLIRLRRQPTKKIYHIRSTGSRPATRQQSVRHHQLTNVPRVANAPSWEDYWADTLERYKRPVVIDGEPITKADVLKDKEEYKQRYKSRLITFIHDAHARGFIVVDDKDYELRADGSRGKKHPNYEE